MFSISKNKSINIWTFELYSFESNRTYKHVALIYKQDAPPDRSLLLCTISLPDAEITITFCSRIPFATFSCNRDDNNGWNQNTKRKKIRTGMCFSFRNEILALKRQSPFRLIKSFQVKIKGNINARSFKKDNRAKRAEVNTYLLCSSNVGWV